MSPSKLAIFVEGQTESIFVKKLLIELAGTKNISFQEVIANRITTLTTNDSENNKKYFVLIVNCQNDNSVKSRILENRQKLIKANFDLAIGLRDIYPITRENISRLEKGMKIGVPTKDLKIEFCLAKMETEAWFLQEQTHYQRIDQKLTNELIIEKTGFDPANDNSELVDQPAALLKDIYRIVGKSYTKTRTQVQRTVNSLDYEEVYTELPTKLEYFNSFISHIDSFIM